MIALTERRAADRAKMAETLRALAVELGAEADVEPYPHLDGRGRRLCVKHGAWTDRAARFEKWREEFKARADG